MLEKCSMKENKQKKIKLKKKIILLKYKKKKETLKEEEKKAYCASVKKEVTQTKIDELKKMST